MQLARAKNHEFATLEHLLLALLEDRSTADVLKGCDVDIDLLRSDLEDFVNEELDKLVVENFQDARPTPAFQRVIQRAVIHVQSAGREEVTGANVLVAIFAERESHAAYFLEQQDMTRLDAVNFMSHNITKSKLPRERGQTRFHDLGEALFSPELDIALDQAADSAAQLGHSEIRPEHVLYELVEEPLDDRIKDKTQHVLQEARSGLFDYLEALPKQSSRSRATPSLSLALAMALRATLLSAAGSGRKVIDAEDVFDSLAPISAVPVLPQPLRPILSSAHAGVPAADPSVSRVKSTPAVGAQVESKIDNGRRPSKKVGTGFAFVSYATADRPLVAKIIASLQNRGISIWWDQDIRGGSWRDAISKNLDACTAHLVLWTAASVESDPVREEAGRGKSNGKLVHALLDDSKLPFGFSEIQYFNLRGWDGETLTPAFENLIQAISDKLKPPTRSQLTARLAAPTRATTTIVNGAVAVVDAPPGVAPPVRDPADLDDRLHAQKHLAQVVHDELCDRRKSQLPQAVALSVKRYLDALNGARLCWYILDDAMSSVMNCRNEYAEDPWPGTSRHDMGTLEKRHKEMEPLVRPRQPKKSSDQPPDDSGPSVTPAKVSKEPIDNAIEAARRSIQDGEDAQLLDSSVGRAAAHYSARLQDAMLETGASENAVKRRHDGARAGLQGLGGVLAMVTEALTKGLRSDALMASPNAKAVLRNLNAALDAVLSFFRP
jgi:hypothetical protein